MPTNEHIESIASRVKEICRFDRRWTGTNAEREAGNYIASELEKLGRSAQIEPIRVRPEFAIVHSLHCFVAVVGSVVSIYVPPLGAALVLLSAVSMFGDLISRFYLFRRLTPARASQNVSSTSLNENAGIRVILSAHHDTGRGGAAYKERSQRVLEFIRRRLKISVGPYSVVFGCMLAVLVLSSLRLANLDSNVFTAVQFAFTAILIVSIAVQLDVALSPAGPGANDNASGVATVLELAGDLADELENTELWLLFPGAEEGLMLGMSEWLKEHGEELNRELTYFVNVDSIGHGIPRYLTKEGFIFFFDFDPELIGLCEKIASEAEPPSALPYRSRVGSDALIPCLEGFRATTVVSLTADNTLPNYHQPEDTPESLDMEAIERNYNFLRNLVLALDKVGTDANRKLYD